jgi:hypothetical protein
MLPAAQSMHVVCCAVEYCPTEQLRGEALVEGHLLPDGHGVQDTVDLERQFKKVRTCPSEYVPDGQDDGPRATEGQKEPGGHDTQD